MDDFYISEDKEKLDMVKIHQAIKTSYWGGYRTPELTATTIERSICFGLYSQDHDQVGFARVLTDGVVFAYIMDVFIFDPYKGKGLGKKLMEHLMKHSLVKNVLTIALKTKDAHGLYENFGFKSVGNSPLWMAIDNAKLD